VTRRGNAPLRTEVQGTQDITELNIVPALGHQSGTLQHSALSHEEGVRARAVDDAAHHVGVSPTAAPSQIMFGSAYPSRPHARTLKERGELGYKDEVMEKIVHKNAESTLGL